MEKVSNTVPLEHLVAKQVSLWESRRVRQEKVPESKVELPFSITISREFGCEDAAISSILSERLRWQVFDKEVVDYIAREARVRHNVIESFDEKIQSEIETWVATLLSGHTLDHEHYFKYLCKVIMTIGHYGDAIIIGRGANFIIPTHACLRVRVTAPIEDRVARVAKETGAGRAQARSVVTSHDKERVSFVHHHFRRDPADPSAYDLTLNTAYCPPEAAANLIICALNDKRTTVQELDPHAS